MQNFVKLLMNSLYGENLREGIKDCYSCKSENWMFTENGKKSSRFLEIAKQIICSYILTR